MPVVSSRFDLAGAPWRRVTDPTCTEYTVDIEYCLLGYDLDCGRLDMLLRFAPGGHCRRHRHIAATATLVLEGEQFLVETLPDGSTREIHRRAGDYALAGADAHPHDEYGGAAGGTVLLSMSAPDGLLFEYFDASMTERWTVSIEEYVRCWNEGSVHGAAPVAASA